jgi:hypothetical protein
MIPAPQAEQSHYEAAHQAIAYWKQHLEATRNVECPYKAPYDVAFESKRKFEIAKLEVLLKQEEASLARLHAAGYEVFFFGGIRWKIIRHQDDGTQFEQELDVSEEVAMPIEQWAEVIGRWGRSGEVGVAFS